jgi:transaldolase
MDLGQTRVFADGADLAAIRRLMDHPLVAGFTTNPTLMRAAGVRHYEGFARELVEVVGRRPISFEVLSDDPSEMLEQARKIASWGDSVYVKIPITTTKGESTAGIQERLGDLGVHLNVTALLTLAQVETAAAALANGPSAFVSVFAGRIADSGRDPVPVMRDALSILAPQAHLELIWASPREVYNVVQAAEIGCHIITITPDLLAKL